MKYKCYILLITLIICYTNYSYAQNRTISLKTSTVQVPDSIKERLAYLELGKNKLESSIDSSYLAMHILNLVNPKDIKFKPGIYSYQILGPHFQKKIFIFYEDKIEIFKSIYINDVLDQYMIFLKKSELPVFLRIKYLTAISKYLKEQYETENE